MFNDATSLYRFFNGKEGKKQIGLKNFLQSFCNRLCEHTDRTSLSAKLVSPFNRRLDSMARLLVGDETCAAVCIIGKTLYISTNKINHSQDSVHCPLYNRIFCLFGYLFSLSKFALENNGIAIQPEFRNYYREDILTATLTPYLMSQLKELNDDKILEVENFLKNFIKNIAASFYNYENTATKVKIDLVEDWANVNYQNNWFNNNFGYVLLQSHKKFIIPIIKKYLQDILKLENAFTDLANNRELIELFASKKLQIEIIDDGGEGIHAEVRMLIRLINENLLDPKNYIGLSKLCCPYCNILIKKFGIYSDEISLEEESNNSIITRGNHGNLHRWNFPENLNDIIKDTLVKNLFGRHLYEQFVNFKNQKITISGEKLTKGSIVLAAIVLLGRLSAKQIRSLFPGVQKPTDGEKEAADSSINLSCVPSILVTTQPGFFHFDTKEITILSGIEEKSESKPPRTFACRVLPR